MIAYCGIDCSKCDCYLATQSGNDADLERVAKQLAKRYRAEVKPAYVICDGCRTGERRSYFCANTCNMRNCCIEKEFHSCIECSEFPCSALQSELNHNPEAKENLKRLKI